MTHTFHNKRHVLAIAYILQQQHQNPQLIYPGAERPFYGNLTLAAAAIQEASDPMYHMYRKGTTPIVDPVPLRYSHLSFGYFHVTTSQQ